MCAEWDADRLADTVGISPKRLNVKMETRISNQFPLLHPFLGPLIHILSIIVDQFRKILGWYIPDGLLVERQVGPFGFFAHSDYPCIYVGSIFYGVQPVRSGTCFLWVLPHPHGMLVRQPSNLLALVTPLPASSQSLLLGFSKPIR